MPPVETEYRLNKEDTRFFKEWIPAQGHRHLFDLLKQCTRPSIWEHCVDGTTSPSTATIFLGGGSD